MALTYDAWGRTASKTLGAKSAQYAYRYGSKLHGVTSNFFDEGNASFEYGADGRRRSAAAGGLTMRYRWDAGWNMINEEDGNGTLTRTYWHHPQAGGRAALAHADGSNPAQGAWGYYLHDHLGSTRRIHNHAKARIARFDYTPYGELFHAENAGVSTRRFTGHDWSAPAALYFAPYRYYNPSAARWLTRDPLVMVDGPNVYAYGNASPLVHVDIEGTSLLFYFIIWNLCPIAVSAINWKKMVSDKSTSDKYKHCAMSCRMARYCLNPAATYVIGRIKEMIDKKYGAATDIDCRDDLSANKYGLKCALRFATCSSCCNKRYGR